ncbi:hypothetical protein CBM2618_P110013 [Cupriavidus taiwanensis]|nr:hypothetical protein CBM2595_P100013 [Cupriavidus taiwanensis]SOZ89689.1 hypothetical protein CBM2618_P110013 [Cupriavidus taiwanensis]SPA54051.1 hypothetical protein CBM2606_P120013 [Cupriavidus taiwanensis]SPC24858.1 hypothetical protein CT19431_P70105 [Cupriavidus taiwanensis]SPD37218.1 protein of unknown function [Cupriavidus taiwanensis]
MASALYLAISARAFHKAIWDCKAASSGASVGRNGWTASAAGVLVAVGLATPAAGAAAVGCIDGAVPDCDVPGLPPADAIAAATGFDIADAALAGAAAERPTVAAKASAAGGQR